MAEQSDISVDELQAMQSAARWLVGAAATVAATLLAGVQLSALGKLTTLDSPLRLGAAIGACVAALVTVGAILVMAARVLVSPGWTLSRLAHLALSPQTWDKHWLQAELRAQRGLLVPMDQFDPGQLYRDHRALLVAQFQLHNNGQVDLDSPSNIAGSSTTRTYVATRQEDVDYLQRRLDIIAAVTARVTAAANLADSRRRYRHLVRVMPWLGAVVVAAVGAFVWATATADTPITRPVAVQVRFIAEPHALTDHGISPGCAGLTIAGVAIGGSLQQPIVVSTADRRCVLNQVLIPAATAIVIPATEAGR